jgi:hypothetical protein
MAETKYGINIASLQIVAFLRDWSHTEANVKKTHGYPESQIKVIDIKLFSKADIVAYLESRVNLFVSAGHLEDSKLPKCTAEERWAKEDCFAVVYADGASKGKAMRGGARFSSEHEALVFMNKANSKKPLKIQYRKGESIRCERYCPAKKFCHQYKEEIREASPF